MVAPSKPPRRSRSASTKGSRASGASRRSTSTRGSHRRYRRQQRQRTHQVRASSRAGVTKEEHALAVSKGLTKYKGTSDPIRNVLMSFLAPCAQQEFRWPLNGSTPESVMTGTAQLHTVFPVNPGAPFEGTYSTPNSWVAFLFRNPLRNFIYLTNTASPFTYNGQYRGGGTTYATEANISGQWLDFAYFNCTSNGAPHGPSIATSLGPQSTLFCGAISSNDSASFVWVGVGDTLSVTASASGDNYNLVYYQNPGAQQPNLQYGPTTAFSSGANVLVTGVKTGNFPTATPYGYYGIVIDSGGASKSYTAPTLVVAAGDVLAHQSVPGAMTHANWMQSVRMNATSLLVSNVAAEFYKEGSAYAALVTDETDFRGFISPSSVTTRTPFYDGKAAKGLYSWLPPTGPTAMIRTDAMSVTNIGTVNYGCFYLDDGNAFSAIRLDCSPTNTFPSVDLKLTVHSQLEYATNDMWAELEFSPIQATLAMDVEQVAMHALPFCENPFHLSMIAGFVSAAASALASHAGVIGKHLGKRFPSVRSIISPFADFANGFMSG